MQYSSESRVKVTFLFARLFSKTTSSKCRRWIACEKLTSSRAFMCISRGEMSDESVSL